MNLHKVVSFGDQASKLGGGMEISQIVARL